MKALAGEIAKNLVLAGVGSLTILDHEVVTEEDLGSQFLLSEEHVGQNVCQNVIYSLISADKVLEGTSSIYQSAKAQYTSESDGRYHRRDGQDSDTRILLSIQCYHRNRP